MRPQRADQGSVLRVVASGTHGLRLRPRRAWVSSLRMAGDYRHLDEVTFRQKRNDRAA